MREFLSKYGFILLCYLIATSIIIRRILWPNVDMQERICWVIVLGALLLLTSAMCALLEQMDETIWKLKSGFQ